MHSHRLVFAAACLGMLLFGIVFLSLGSVNNMLAARFGLDANEIGTLTALLPFGILTGSLVFGPIVDRFGYKWMLVAAALIVGAALEGIAFTDEKRIVQLCVYLIGFGGGILNGATNALVADVSEGERSAKLNLLGVFFGIGALAMPFTLAILSERFSLTGIVAGIGAAVAIPIAFTLAIRFPPPKQRTEKFSFGNVLELLGSPIFVFAVLALGIQSGMEGMSNDWLTRYFKNVTLAGEEFQEWKTQLSLVALTSAMLITRLALATMLKGIDSRLVIFASIAIAAVGQSLLLASPGYAVSFVAAFLVGVGLAGTFPIVLSYIGDRFPHYSGTAFSLTFVVALLGNMTINKSFGYLAQNHGIEQYPKIMLVLLACSAGLLALVVRLLGGRSSR